MNEQQILNLIQKRLQKLWSKKDKVEGIMNDALTDARINELQQLLVQIEMVLFGIDTSVNCEYCSKKYFKGDADYKEIKRRGYCLGCEEVQADYERDEKIERLTK